MRSTGAGLPAKIVAEMEKHGGLIDAGSLAAYEPAIRDAARGTYRGYEGCWRCRRPVLVAFNIVQMLNILENFPMADFGGRQC